MRVKLIVPGWPSHSLWAKMPFKFPSLNLITLAAYTPQDVKLSLSDENVESLSFDESVDLVGITVMTPLAKRAYTIADRYREKGVKVVLGGFHPTWMTEEALRHADAVVIGEGEESWPKIISDLEKGKLSKIYKSMHPTDMECIKMPRRDLLDGKRYLFTNMIQITRGCPYGCEFCSVSAFFGKRFRMRPVETVIEELSQMVSKNIFVFIVDDNLVAEKRYAEMLFNEMSHLKIKWLSHASLDFAHDKKLVALAAKSGCVGLFVGIESLNENNFLVMGKKVNQRTSLKEAIKVFHDHGIGVLTSFILGYDYDTQDTFDALLEFCYSSKVDSALFPILTPFPGTVLRERFINEHRLLNSDWTFYDMEHVAFQPTLMNVQELQEGFERVNAQFWSIGSMFKRLCKFQRSNQVFIPMNIGFRSAWKKRAHYSSLQG